MVVSREYSYKLSNGLVSCDVFKFHDAVDLSLWHPNGGFQTMVTKQDWDAIDRMVRECFEEREGVEDE